VDVRRLGMAALAQPEEGAGEGAMRWHHQRELQGVLLARHDDSNWSQKARDAKRRPLPS
jgi:hypothetical protein